jgi:ABC-type Fe3+-hydroxamate transport system substrate-binding protein
MVVWRFGDRPGEPLSERAQQTGPVRIVSLVPSLTELLFALGLGPQVVGRTGFCVHPAHAVRAVPKVGGTKSVDVEAVLALSPTHLIVNVDENERPTVERLARDVPEVVVTHPLTLADNLALYECFGERFGREREARRLADRFHEARQALAAQHWPQRDAVYLIWKDPWMTVAPDTYIADMLAQVGLRALAPESQRRYPQVDWAQWSAWNSARASHSDTSAVVLFSSEPYRFSAQHAQAFAQQQGIDPQRCVLVDGEMLSWYGPRAIEGLHYLGALRARIEERAP